MTFLFTKIYTGVIYMYVSHIQAYVCKITEIYTDAIYHYVPHKHVYKVRDMCTFVKIQSQKWSTLLYQLH